MNTAVGLILVILLIGANAFFVAVEFAFLAADRSKLRAQAERGSWPAKTAIGVLRRLSFHLSGAQLGITVSSLVLGFLAEPLVGDLINPALGRVGIAASSTASVVVILFIATILQMVIGELIPKNVAIASPERITMSLAPVARIVHGAFSPLIRLFNSAADWTVRKLGIEPQEELSSITSIEEIEFLIRLSGDSGALAPDAQALLTKTIRFGDKVAADALTPRVHIDAVSHDATVAELIELAKDTRHSRYPVYGADLDDVRGIVLITSIFNLAPSARAKTPVVEIMVDPLVVPETRDLADVLDDFRTSQARVAVVVDEHGGTAGLLTLEDVLEEIVGDVDDEYDVAENLTEGVRPGIHIVAGTLHPDEVAEACGFEVPPGDYETIAGFVLDQMGRIPAEGDQFQVDGWNFVVVEMDNLRIASLQLAVPKENLDRLS